VLALVHDHLVPPRDTKGIDVREAEWKMEFDVIETLREIGHDVRVRGVHDDLRGIRATVQSFNPHIVFNLLEAFAGITDVRPERRELPRAAAPALHRLQSRAG
jgi:D-alanine-D-alanine ligase